MVVQLNWMKGSHKSRDGRLCCGEPRGMGRKIAIAVGTFLAMPLTLPLTAVSPSVAETVPTLLDCTTTYGSVVYSKDRICRQGLTTPSLWWIKEQVGSQLGKKLVSDWKTEPMDSSRSKVVLSVNSQAWSLLDYFERYEFLHAFGLVANDFGYALEVQDSRGAQMASYRCGAESDSPCRIQFGGSGSGFRGGNRRLF